MRNLRDSPFGVIQAVLPRKAAPEEAILSEKGQKIRIIAVLAVVCACMIGLEAVGASLEDVFISLVDKKEGNN